jgi:hypothetical protein
VANALEHGFAGRTSGRIKVAIVRSATDGLEVTVRNDGHDLPAGFRMERSNSLGLRIATTLARAAGGRFQLRSDKGGGRYTHSPGMPDRDVIGYDKYLMVLGAAEDLPARSSTISRSCLTPDAP